MVDLIVKSKLKEAVPEGMRVSGELAEALNKVVEELLKKAGERAKANKRSTVMAYDL